METNEKKIKLIGTGIIQKDFDISVNKEYVLRGKFGYTGDCKIKDNNNGTQDEIYNMKPIGDIEILNSNDLQTSRVDIKKSISQRLYNRMYMRYNDLDLQDKIEFEVWREDLTQRIINNLDGVCEFLKNINK